MLLDDVHITISEIQRLQEKGRTMTLAEKDQLDMHVVHTTHKPKQQNHLH